MNKLLSLRGLSRNLFFVFLQLACLAGFSPAHAESSDPYEVKASLGFAEGLDQYLMVYSSNEATSGPNIYGRALRSDGSPVGRDFRLSTQTGKMTKPVLAYGARTERFLIVWGRKSYDGSKAEIVGLSAKPNGAVGHEEFHISVSDLYDQRPAVAYCPGRDSFLVTWSRGPKYDYENGSSDVYGQFVAGDGSSLQGSNFLIASDSKNQFKQDVDCDLVNDRFLVVWEDQRQTATKGDIYGQLISSDGGMLGKNFLIAGTGNNERRPVLAANSTDGTHLVVWETEMADGTTRLFSHTIDPNGGLLRGPTPIGPELGGDRGRASVAYLKPQDVFLVAFDNSAIGDVSDGVYGQFVNSSGKLRQTAFPLTTAKLAQYRPDVAAAKNTFLVVWTDYRSTDKDPGKHNVYEYYGRVIGSDMALSSRWKNPESR
ncbi:MAG TPA: hypothetical protein VLA61_18510 [Ideonella sp.]|uniref:hypothetical protein n=1 Tax=Ideonella sp. TaxID=1929293 RepID=UPI002BFFB0BF|nr:hypothetical protein [Ideonella sp.]HSI50269.1 hypothetical protein [Ideonella sp.]